jgi:hypothetical protein
MTDQEREIGRLVMPPTAEDAIALYEAISGKTLTPQERREVEEGFEAMLAAREEGQARSH